MVERKRFSFKAPLCKGSCREATEGLFCGKFNFYNPSVIATQRHLPLHKGGLE